MRNIVFEAKGFEQFNSWALENKKIYKKIIKLINNIQRTPYEGLGKPERLKHQLSEYWSRRITSEHRLVYKVTEDNLIIVSCKYHYDK